MIQSNTYKHKPGILSHLFRSSTYTIFANVTDGLVSSFASIRITGNDFRKLHKDEFSVPVIFCIKLHQGMRGSSGTRKEIHDDRFIVSWLEGYMVSFPVFINICVTENGSKVDITKKHI